MRWLLLLCCISLFNLSCKKSDTAAKRLAGIWEWTKTDDFYGDGVWGTRTPSETRSSFFIFKNDKSFSRIGLNAFQTPVGASGEFKLVSLPPDDHPAILFDGENIQTTVELEISENKLIFIERLSANDVHYHEYIRE